MTKSQLIDYLYHLFEEDKEVIKRNLLECMPNCNISVKDSNLEATLTVKIQSIKEEKIEYEKC